jgi:cytochrome b561
MAEYYPCMSPPRYATPAIVLHWLIAALVIALIALGWWMQEIPKQPPGPRADMYNLHKSIGLLAGVLIAAMLAWRATHRPPELPPMPRWQARLAHVLHVVLYLLLATVAVTGYLGSAYSGYPVKFFGATLPAWAGKDNALKELMSAAHLWGSWALTAVILVHVGAVAKHTFVDRDALLRRMGWPATSALREE